MKLDYQPEGIIVTMPVNFIEEYKWSNFICDMDALNSTIDNDNPALWFRVVKNLPTIQPPHCYIIASGRIRYRTNILEFRRHANIDFPRPDGTRVYFKDVNIIVLCGPAIRPPRPVEMKGFQGFRYTPLLF